MSASLAVSTSFRLISINVLVLFAWLLSMSMSVTDAAIYKTANITANCDDELTVYYESEVDSTAVQIGYLNNWRTSWQYQLTDVSSKSKLYFDCYDYGGIGGFISEITLGDGTEYLTVSPITDGNYELDSSSDGVTTLVYYERDYSAWANAGGDITDISDGAYWYWNANTMNTMIFSFDFANIVDS
jgi:hypothetical protein